MMNGRLYKKLYTSSEMVKHADKTLGVLVLIKVMVELSLGQKMKSAINRIKSLARNV